jgi:hypothetical protein
MHKRPGGEINSVLKRLAAAGRAGRRRTGSNAWRKGTGVRNSLSKKILYLPSEFALPLNYCGEDGKTVFDFGWWWVGRCANCLFALFAVSVDSGSSSRSRMGFRFGAFGCVSCFRTKPRRLAPRIAGIWIFRAHHAGGGRARSPREWRHFGPFWIDGSAHGARRRFW